MTVTSALWLPGWAHGRGQRRGLRAGGVASPKRGAVVGTRTAVVRALLKPSRSATMPSLCRPTRRIRVAVLGDPTEAALLVARPQGRHRARGAAARWHARAEIPFDSAAKMMAHAHGRTRRRQPCLHQGRAGAAARSVRPGADWQRVAALDDRLRRQILTAGESLAAAACACPVAVAESDDELDEASRLRRSSQAAPRLLGLIGQIDPPREEAKVAVADCRAAGIRPGHGHRRPQGSPAWPLRSNAGHRARRRPRGGWPRTGGNAGGRTCAPTWTASPSSPACIRRKSSASWKPSSARRSSSP